MKAPVKPVPEIRCRGCNRLIARGIMEAGELELHCPRCKTRVHLWASRPSLAPHDGLHGDRYERENPSSQQ